MKSWIKYFVFTCVMLIFSFSKSYAHSWEFKWKEKLPGGVKAKMIELTPVEPGQWKFTLRLVDPILSNVAMKWGYVTTALDSEDFDRKRVSNYYNQFKTEVLDNATEWVFATKKAPKKRTYGVRQVIETEVLALPKKTERNLNPNDLNQKTDVELNTTKMKLLDRVRNIELFELPGKYPYEPISVPSDDSEQERLEQERLEQERLEQQDNPFLKTVQRRETARLEKERMEKERLVEIERLKLKSPDLFTNVITIGAQVWMTKNLDVDTFRNGDPIPQAKTFEEWDKADENKQPAWCYYDNDPANGAKYGKLYNWYAVNDSRGLAPVGFHIPTVAEWTKLEDFLGSDAGTKMKSKSGWNSYTTGGSKTCPNCVSWNAEYRRKVPCHTCQDWRLVSAPKVSNSGNGTNTSGFSGLPGGYRGNAGSFNHVGYCGYWWGTSANGSGGVWYRYLHYKYDIVNGGNGGKTFGYSVRCLRD